MIQYKPKYSSQSATIEIIKSLFNYSTPILDIYIRKMHTKIYKILIRSEPSDIKVIHHIRLELCKHRNRAFNRLH